MAERILTSLSSPAYLSRGTSNAAILLHGTYAEPQGSADTGLTWGDYYFLEALLRYRALQNAGKGGEHRAAVRAFAPRRISSSGC
ncbi:MAG TPA: hypothetical protein VGI87_01800 [Solirubrobacteraceae bacterium]